MYIIITKSTLVHLQHISGDAREREDALYGWYERRHWDWLVLCVSTGRGDQYGVDESHAE